MAALSARNNWRINALIAVFAAAAMALLFLPERLTPPISADWYWNGAVAFLITAFLCDAWGLRTRANTNTSVSFLPFFAATMLFPHPVPMAIAGLTAVITETFVRRKAPQRVLFNTCQYMVAVGAGGVVYGVLGGQPLLSSISTANPEFVFKVVPFIGLVVTYFAINNTAVALAVTFTSELTLGEAYERLSGGARVYDFLASSLAILLAFLYVKLQLVGLVVVVFPIFLVRQLYHMNLELQNEMEEKLELMVKAIEARDPYTSGHSRRVAEYAVAIARELGLSTRLVDSVKRAALLHDVGKIYEEFAPLLRKEDKLSPEERIVMETHVTRSAELVATVSKLKGHVLDAVKHHHENYDGTGYPDGLSGEDIPVGARIIMIADTLDAMTTDRPYRKALGFEQVVDELRKYAGRQFDPRISEVLVRSTTIRRLIGVVDGQPSRQPAAVATFGGRFSAERAPRAQARGWRDSEERPSRV
ncbi:MAG TPA: HD-GYP domain-containing protein [Gemmatimonadales bacterium]|nr:HD-GYP domain-containing protein [Gemmatimonadales bacterium]